MYVLLAELPDLALVCVEAVFTEGAIGRPA